MIFRKLNESDFPYLLKWIMTSHVREWWDSNVNWTAELISSKYSSYVKGYKILKLQNNTITKPMNAYIIEIDSVPIGYIQYYNRYDFPPEQGYDMKFLPKSCGAIDFYIGEVSFLSKGYGTMAVKNFSEKIVSREFENVLVDPELNNLKAIKCYEKAGFEIIKQTENIAFMIKKFSDLSVTNF